MGAGTAGMPEVNVSAKVVPQPLAVVLTAFTVPI